MLRFFLKQRLWVFLLMSGFALGGIAGVVLQLVVTFSSSTFRPAMALYGLSFLLIEVPVGAVLGLIAASIPAMFSLVFAGGSRPGLAIVVLGLAGFLGGVLFEVLVRLLLAADDSPTAPILIAGAFSSALIVLLQQLHRHQTPGKRLDD
ncbi:hypothetical protein [Agreia sp. Leaf283]|uniref:hypothetical protein n=1 Tax=Agreia sp. Leaf283 TaxID=1736321 RepID=UPI0006F1E328|nr:hypothetical protein [Agreia sp. Leaf283]KQP57015.1 hypothetical protein ASF51_03805 [Agreia sp. Leaf283]